MLHVTLTRRFALASNSLFGKQNSNIVYSNEKFFPFANAKRFNAHFYNGKVSETPMENYSWCKHNDNRKLMCKTTLNERRYSLIRFYSGDPSVKFLSGGQSTSFEDNAVRDNDKFLTKVITRLKEDNGIDVCVIETSEERRKYADYVVVVGGRSTRHLKAMTSHIHQQFKKDYPEKSVIVTGLNSKDWMIVDFGSVVIHLFLPEIREKYELEKLWSLGPEHDEQYQEMLADDRYAELVKNAKLEDFLSMKSPVNR